MGDDGWTLSAKRVQNTVNSCLRKGRNSNVPKHAPTGGGMPPPWAKAMEMANPMERGVKGHDS